MSSRKKDRIESKKRKVAAFLALAQSDEDILKNQNKDGSTKGKSPEQTSNEEQPNSANKPVKKKNLSAMELSELRAELRKRQKESMQHPKLYLCLEDLVPTGSTEQHIPGPPPLFVLDIQHLLLYALQGPIASYKPRWCKLLRWSQVKKILVLVLNGLDVSHMYKHSQSLPALRDHFEMRVELISPMQYDCTVKQELFKIPLSKRAQKKASLAVAATDKSHKVRDVKVVPAIPVVPAPAEHNDDPLARKDLLLSPHQLVEESYPLPITFPNGRDPYFDYVYTKFDYEEVTETSPMFSLDCEMCLTNVVKLELTKIAVVDEKHKVIYKTLVKPRNPIRNYLTKYSGVTAAMLRGVTTRLEDVQAALRRLLPPDAILCGHSLNGDLNALKMFHPYVIDTSVIYNLSGTRSLKPSLRRLASHFLDKVIQNSKHGHSPVEDAVSALELVQLKLQNGIDFGDVILGGVIFPRLDHTSQSIRDKIPAKKPRIESFDEHDVVVAAQDTSSATDLAQDSTQDIAQDSTRDPAQDSTRGPVQDSTRDPAQDSTHHMAQDLTQDTAQDSTQDTAQDPVQDSAQNPAQDHSGQWKVFLQQPPSCQSVNFFNLVAKEKKSVAVIGDSLEKLGNDGASLFPASNDKKIVKTVPTALQDNYMVYTELNTCSKLSDQSLPADETQELLSKLNKRLSKLLPKLEADTLVSVLLPGNSSHGSYSNALCLCKVITPIKPL